MAAASPEAGSRETLMIAGFLLDGNKWDGIDVGCRKGDEPIIEYRQIR
ncbi:hypothetical protein ACE103_29480 [Bradyrhizobium sp. ma5]